MISSLLEAGGFSKSGFKIFREFLILMPLFIIPLRTNATSMRINMAGIIAGLSEKLTVSRQRNLQTLNDIREESEAFDGSYCRLALSKSLRRF